MITVARPCPECTVTVSFSNVTTANDNGRTPGRDAAEGAPGPRRTKLAALFVLGSLVTAAVIWVGVPLAQGVIHNFGVRDNRAEVAWKSIVPEFGDARGCARCHSTEGDRLHSAQHANIGCQSCHGALAEHEEHPTIGVKTPPSSVCTKCHIKVDAQPDALHAVVLSEHYVATCLACHDPHTSQAKRPPVIGHPTKGIPTCITCHGPASFKARTIRHPDVTGEADSRCLECHKAGSGPGMEPTNG